MTAYLNRKNRSARMTRISEALFEWFISHLGDINGALVCWVGLSVFAVCVLLAVLGLADMACK